MIRRLLPLLLAVGVSCAPALAAEDTVALGPEGFTDPLSVTTVQIRETEEPGAIAEVFYRNRGVNVSSRDDGRSFIEWNGIEVEVIFDHDYGGDSPDLITIFPPDGVMCRPACELLLHENRDGTIYLIENVVS